MNFYLHIPFCLSKCNYCGFYSRAIDSLSHPACGGSGSECAEGGIWDTYLAEIMAQIEYWKAKPAKTIFFGGGTPSLMPPEIFNKIVAALRPLPDCEITMEANPTSAKATAGKPGTIFDLEKYNINRISIGVQSLNDDDLKFLGRRHTVADALDLIRRAKDLGLRVSADFIYGLPPYAKATGGKPGQTVADVRRMCQEINKLGLEHCSMYELSIEPGTPFAKMNLQMPDNETMAQMYEAIGETLTLPRYEVSNYGNPCCHNANVWDGEQYIGLGDGAVGRVIIDGQWYETLNNKHKILTTRDRAIEKIITGLRTTRGVKLTPDVCNVINWNYIENNKSLTTDDRRLTTDNFLLLDSILIRLIK